jgi:hypothetical protein
MNKKKYHEELASLLRCFDGNLNDLQVAFGRIQTLTDLLSETEDSKYSVSCVASLYSSLFSPVNEKIDALDLCLSDIKRMNSEDNSDETVKDNFKSDID